MFHAKTKHIDGQYHFICDIVAQEQVISGKMYIGDNTGGMLTKSLPN
jgi:hypothetical protein